MKLVYFLSLLSFASVTISYPVGIISRDSIAVRNIGPSSIARSNDGTTLDSLDDLKSGAKSSGQSTSAKGSSTTGKGSTSSSSSSGAEASASSDTQDSSSSSLTSSSSSSSSSSGAKAGSSWNAPSASAVQQAAMNFAKDANTVSASLNQLPDETSTSDIKSLATTAFNAESDEDAQRAVLSAAAGSAGSVSNSLIVENTPTVLSRLQAIIDSPTAASVKSNVATIQEARNPNILPSITQLSDAALEAVGSSMTQQDFPPTGS